MSNSSITKPSSRSKPSMMRGRVSSTAKTGVSLVRPLSPSVQQRTNRVISIVDKVLESCFQLLSLFFMTIGRNSEAPAAYALTSTIKRLLDHLSEANLYSAKDLDSMSKTLERLEGMVSKSGHNSSPYLTELLGKRVELCK